MSESRSCVFRRCWAVFLIASKTFLIVLICFLLLTGCGVKKTAPLPVKTPEKTESPKKEADLYQQANLQGIADWHLLIREKRAVSEMEKLEAVNSFFNQLVFVDDLSHWGKVDYWATPREMLLTYGGDCEDFAIAKYFTLLHLNTADEKMRLTYVKSLTRQKPHMVLCYYTEPTAEPLILDSLIKSIVPASKRRDLVPIYSFNGKGLWLSKTQGPDYLLGSSECLSLWRELKLRFNQEAVAAPIPE